MKSFCLLVLCSFFTSLSYSQQPYTVGNVHAHNDYEHNIPFVQAYGLGLGSIEADVILRNDTLYVAHDQKGLAARKLWFEADYILPLQAALKAGKRTTPVILLIDLKTEAIPTLAKVVSIIEKYPELTTSPLVKFVITGNQPAAADFDKYPEWVKFDGSMNNEAHLKNLKRIGIFSDNFRSYSKWNGKGYIPSNEKKLLEEAIKKVHDTKKQIRFWGCPDNINTWYTFMDLSVDFINTDRIEQLASFMKKLDNTVSNPANQYELYNPTYANDRKGKKVKNIILMIGDGTGLTQWYAGYTGNQGKLNVFNIKSVGLSITASADSYITESAAGASAIATGHKTNNNFVSVLPDSSIVPSIPEILYQKNIATGVITTGDVTDATPAAFYAHVPNRSYSEAIAAGFLQSNLNILMGAGEPSFNQRSDGKDILKAANEKGYTVLTDIKALDTVKNSKLLLLDDVAGLPSYRGRGDFLQRSLAHSTSALSKNKKGFFLMAEGAQIDWAGHSNKMEWMVQEVQDFDKAIGDMMKYVDENKETLLIVTADHETGGLTLLNGSLHSGKVAGQYASDDHTAVCVPVFAYGPQSDLFSGVYQNTEIFKKIMLLLAK